MAEHSEISWTDATFNPWWGCTKVSPACDNCYAERDANRFAPGRVLWGTDAERRTFGEKHWNEPRRWAKTLPAKLGRRPRVFCASMADVFDNHAPNGERERLWRLIAETPELDWLLLSKRIGNAWSMLPPEWVDSLVPRMPENLWLGATVVNQREADRDVPKLLALPAAVRFLSVEPMLGPVDLRELVTRSDRVLTEAVDALRGELTCVTEHGSGRTDRCASIAWVIAGGESGPYARPMPPSWVRSLRDQCAATGVPFHFKQWGEWAPAFGSEQMKRAAVSIHDGSSFPLAAGERARSFNMLDRQPMVRTGKQQAGRELDGRTHDAFPSGVTL